jgi:two-component system, OmpR family, copper resistance phosphate regulon response regulator CusR
MKILLVEDDPRISAFVKLGLEESGYCVTVAYDSAMAEKIVFHKVFDILLLDVVIPGISGLELCKKIRNANITTPVIMLTSLDTVEDKLAGFDCGADDYLVKPFNFKELLARIKALLRRHHETFTVAKINMADLELDNISKKVTRNEKEIKLTAKEYAILELLVSHKGKVFDRMEIAEKIWGFSFNSGTNLIDVHINSLRNKIDKDFWPKLIHTQVGFGYVMKEEV